jgi:SAM-dependent methyltransferase
MNKRLNIYYWLRKFFVTKVVQKILNKIFFLDQTFLRKTVFFLIYKTNHWNKYKPIDKKDLLVSGPGSNPNTEQIKNLIINLNNFIKRNDIRSILDLPCGDFAWMRHLIEINNNIQYTGFDIVEEVIKVNNYKYSSNNIKFFSKDILNEKNFDGHDLVFVRDFFIHISINEILKVLDMLKKSKVKFFACTSYNDIKFNADIAIGKHRKINLLIEPFNLTEVFFKFSENKLNDNKYINFYKIQS